MKRLITQSLTVEAANGDGLATRKGKAEGECAASIPDMVRERGSCR